MLKCEQYLYVVIQLRHLICSSFILKVDRLFTFSFEITILHDVLCVSFGVWYPLIFGTVRMLRSHRAVADHGLHSIQR